MTSACSDHIYIVNYMFLFATTHAWFRTRQNRHRPQTLGWCEYLFTAVLILQAVAIGYKLAHVGRQHNTIHLVISDDLIHCVYQRAIAVKPGCWASSNLHSV